MIIPFGKYQGKELKSVPLKYIAWLLTKYQGYKIPRDIIEKEAIRRGCEQRDGKWGIDRFKLRKTDENFDLDGFGQDAMYGIIREYNFDKDLESPDDDPYDYYGIPNTDY